MDIGKEERTIIIEPVTTPVPRREPAPAKEPVKVPVPEREKVPAGAGTFRSWREHEHTYA